MAYENFIPTVWAEAINRELEKAEEIFMQGYNAANTLLDQLKADQGTIWKDESNYQIIK